MRLLTMFCLLFSFGLMAKDYKSLQRLNEGDVISAEVFNDIMDRIELTLKPITISELAGTWAAKQYVCKRGDFPNCEKYYDRTISIPFYPSLTNDQIYSTIKIIKDYIKKSK